VAIKGLYKNINFTETSYYSFLADCLFMSQLISQSNLESIKGWICSKARNKLSILAKIVLLFFLHKILFHLLWENMKRQNEVFAYDYPKCQVIL